ncbi:MAG: hypothetical protein ACI3WR_06335 [Oscillospiraceae bacterium]
MSEEKELETTRGGAAETPQAETPQAETPQAEAPRQEAPKTVTTRSGKPQKPVYVYLIALFAVALLLMSLSFFMSHRSNLQVMGELRESMNSMQLLQEAEERNAELNQQILALEDRITAQRETIYELQQEVYSLQQQLLEAQSEAD